MSDLTREQIEAASVSTHTPGPWKVSIDPQPGIDTADGSEAIIYGGSALTFRGILGDNAAQMAANARLIAAAPDYHAAALDICARHDDKARRCNFEWCGCEDCKPFRPIIDRATGKKGAA